MLNDINSWVYGYPQQLSVVNSLVIRVSVIVPVYRAKKYLPELLDSLLNQTSREMEFIFVDDRGGDGTFDIVREAAKYDSRIVCLENEQNSGPGYSRNRGIEVARGEFIAFADADDFMATDFYEQMYRRAVEGKCLVVKGTRNKLLADGSVEESPLNDRIQKRMGNYKTPMCLFTYEHQSGIFSRDLVLLSGAQNAENSRYDEDTCFLMMVLKHVPISRFALARQAVYYYRQHDASLVQQKRGAYFLQQSNNSAEFKIDYLLQQTDSEDIVKYLASTFEERLGGRLDAAQKDGIDNAIAYEYLCRLAQKLKEWQSHQELAFAPGALASALLDENFKIEHFYILRKVYRKLAAVNQNIVVLQKGLNTVRQQEISRIRCDIRNAASQQVSFKASVQAWQQEIEQRFCKPLDVVEGLLERICRCRMEVYQQGGNEDCFTLSGADDLQVSSPAWLCQNGYGVMLQGKIGAYALRVHVKQEGRLLLRFRGCDVRGKNGRVPAWVDVASLRVDGVDYGAHTVWHDKPYTVQMDAQAGQTVTVELITQPHLHTDEEVVRLLEAFYPKKAWSDDERKIMVGQLQSRFAALRGVSLPELHSRTVDQQIQLRNLSDDCQALQVQHNSLQTAHVQLESKTTAIEKSLSAELSAVGKILTTKLNDTGQVIAEQKRTITSQQSKLESLETSLRESERRLAHTRKELAAAVRIQQLGVLMPRLWWRYQILRLKKTFSFGKRRERYKQKIKAIKPLIREYRNSVRQIQASNGYR